MSYDRNPDAQYIIDCAKRLRETEWANQRKLDDRIAALLRGKDWLDVAEPASQAGTVQIKPVRTGRPGVASDRNAATLSQRPTQRVNPLDPADIESVRHADSLLEPFLEADWRLSGMPRAFYLATKDLGDYSRGFICKYPIPRLWATPEYQEMWDEMVALNNQRADAEGEDAKRIDAERKALQARIDSYLADYYPIKARHLPARSTYIQWSDECYLPEVVECLRMKPSQINADFPDADVDPKGTTEMDVYRYHNWRWTKTVLADGKQILHEWEHGMGMNPVVMMETNIIADEPGMRWKPPLIDHADMLETENEILSDIRHNFRRNTLVGPKITVDPDQRGIADPKTEALKREIEYKPGEPLFLIRGEEEDGQFAPQINQQGIYLLEFVANYNAELVLNPVEAGKMLSGQAAVGYTTALQAAQVRLDPYRDAIEEAMRCYGKLSMRCVRRLDESFSGMKIKVTGKAKGKNVGIEVGASDLEGWENQVQPLISSLLPVNQNNQMALATAAMGLTLPPDHVLESYLQKENASELIDQWYQWQIMQALVQQLVGNVQQRAGELAQQPGGSDVQQLAQNIAQLPPEAQAPLGGMMGGNGMAGGMAKGMANQAQTGIPNNGLSETGAQQIA